MLHLIALLLFSDALANVQCFVLGSTTADASIAKWSYTTFTGSRG